MAGVVHMYVHVKTWTQCIAECFDRSATPGRACVYHDQRNRHPLDKAYHRVHSTHKRTVRRQQSSCCDILSSLRCSNGYEIRRPDAKEIKAA